METPAHCHLITGHWSLATSFPLALSQRQIYCVAMRGACLNIQSGPAAVGIGGGQGGQGGQGGASPQRADCRRAAHGNSRQLTGRGLGSQMAEPTPASAKRRAAEPLLISRRALNAVNRMPAETDCPGRGLGKTGDEGLPSELPGLVGFRGTRRLVDNMPISSFNLLRFGQNSDSEHYAKG